ENEAWRVGTHHVDQQSRACDVAAHHTKPLGEGTFDDVHLVEHAIAFSDATTAWTINTDRMHLVEIGDAAILVGKVANLADGRDIAIHRINRFEGHDLGLLRIKAL